MPIKVTCACGQSFAANDALAGKRVKCPKCAQPLQIPAAGQAGLGGPMPSQTAAQRPMQQPARPAPQPPAGGIDSLFDEAGITAQSTSGPTCPNCRAPLAPNAVLCVQCGYNLKLGRQMQTVRTTAGGTVLPGGGGGHGGHGEVSATLMERAARAIEEEAEAERSKTSEGFPWYGYAGMLAAAILFMAAMRFIPHGSALQIAGSVGIFLGFMIQMYANIRIWIVAFKEGVVHGIGCVFCGCYDLYYVITRWDMCSGFVTLWCIGWGVGFFAQILVSFAQAFLGGEAKEEDAFIPTEKPVPAHVRVEQSPVLSVPLLRDPAFVSSSKKHSSTMVA